MKLKRNTLRSNFLKSGFDSKVFPSGKLLQWLEQPRNPILSSPDGLAKIFIEAMLSGRTVKFIYIGGSQAGAPRSIKVSLVFRVESEQRVYVAGYCPERAANRVFALDRIMLVHSWN